MAGAIVCLRRHFGSEQGDAERDARRRLRRRPSLRRGFCEQKGPAVTKFCPRMRDMSQDFTGIPGTEKQTRTERSYGCPGPPGWSKFTGPYPLDLISTVLAAWHQKSLLQVCRDLEKSRSQSMAVSDVGQLERWVQVCPPHAPHTAPLTCADLL